MVPALSDEETKKIIGAAEERFEDMRTERAPHEDSWRQISEYVCPRRTFELVYGTPSIRKRRLIDTTGVVANQRLAALIFGYMMPPYRPWVRPKVTGRDPSHRESVWFERRQKHMFDHIHSPASNFTSAGHESMIDDCAFGNSVLWCGKKDASSPAAFKAVPLMECFWQENAECLVDTVYRAFKLKLGVAARKYPSPKLLEKLQQKGAEREWIDFLHVVEPREGGIAGAVAERKPFKSIVICLSTKEVVNISGYDTFPYMVTRFGKRAGENYGEGPGLDTLPLARLLNEVEETIVRAAELQADPPMVSMLGHIPKLDRRPGALTNLTAAQVRRMDDPKDILRRLYEGGDVTISIEVVRDIRQQINFVNFIDWMTLPSNGNTTATEVNERRDIRLRSMTPIVSRGETEKLTRAAERLYDLTQDEFDAPPETLHGEDLGWEYFSPLAQAQQMTALETYDRVMRILEGAAVFNPEIGDTVDLDMTVRDAVIAAGLPHKDIRPDDQVKAMRAQRAQQRQQEQALMQAQMGAAAARDGAQAAASLRGARAA